MNFNYRLSRGGEKRKASELTQGQTIYYLNINREGKISFWQSLFTQEQKDKFQGNSLHQIQQLERM